MESYQEQCLQDLQIQTQLAYLIFRIYRLAIITLEYSVKLIIFNN